MTATLLETNVASLGKIGSYSGFQNFYNVSGLTLGKDFAMGSRYDSTSVNQNITFGWQLPATGSAVRGYLQTAFGNYDWTDPTVQITPKKVTQITQLQTTVAYQAVGVAFSLLHEFYLTTTAHASGQSLDKVAEVGCFPHVSQDVIDYMNGVTQIGTFTDPAGRGWTVARDATSVYGGPYTMFRPTNGADVQGTIYWTEMLAYLVAQAVLTGQEYFNGIAFGPEPVKGAGATQVSMSVTYS